MVAFYVFFFCLLLRKQRESWGTRNRRGEGSKQTTFGMNQIFGSLLLHHTKKYGFIPPLTVTSVFIAFISNKRPKTKEKWLDFSRLCSFLSSS
jgi:hypothetical protein